jgi:hypothetical protein
LILSLVLGPTLGSAMTYELTDKDRAVFATIDLEENKEFHPINMHEDTAEAWANFWTETDIAWAGKKDENGHLAPLHKTRLLLMRKALSVILRYGSTCPYSQIVNGFMLFHFKRLEAFPPGLGSHEIMPYVKSLFHLRADVATDTYSPALNPDGPPLDDERFVTGRGAVIEFSHAKLKAAFQLGVRLALYDANPERLIGILAKLFTEPVENSYATFTARKNRLAVPVELLSVLQDKLQRLYKAFPRVFPEPPFTYCFQAVETVYSRPNADRDFLDQIVRAHYRSLRGEEAQKFLQVLFFHPVIGPHYQSFFSDLTPCPPLLGAQS